MTAAERLARLPTAAKLLLILTAVLLPIGIALTVLGEKGIREADAMLDTRNHDQARAAATEIESLIARNALALRIAANGALAGGAGDACGRAGRSLAIAPAVAQRFELEGSDGKPICAVGDIGDIGQLPLVAPGNIRAQITPAGNGVALRVGVNGGTATSVVGLDELRTAALESRSDIRMLALSDGGQMLKIVSSAGAGDADLRSTDWPIANGALTARISTIYRPLTAADRVVLLLPVLMWIAAALLTWLLVSRLLVQPLKRLQRAVLRHRPGQSLVLPERLGPSAEIQELRDAFARTVAQLQGSESEAATALEGQRRLVREVHHRVKNNLQVVASLLNIQGRSAESVEAQAAYAAISRRVGALSIVHRNHFADMEENRGIALRPLVAELVAELRATAPESARGATFELEFDTLNTTQDAAVAVAFLITEVVEYALLHAPHDAIEISLRRTSDLTARLSLGSPVLVPDDDDEREKVQFERIVGGLAKQLRSPLDRKLGRYSVDLPVFPPS
jgi:two-component sensor histidine kinase